jgi:hypothetical protein
MQEYISIYKNVHTLLRELGKEISSLIFSEKDDKLELYGLVLLNLTKQQVKAIYLLLENRLYPSVLILIRNIFEAFFNYQWILRATTQEEKIERVLQLEGKAFNDIEKELNVMKEDSKSSDPIWSPEMFKEKEDFLEFLKTHYSELTFNDNGKIKFKEPKERSFEQRLNKMERLKFYSIYRFTSAFVHPTPIIRDVLLKREGSDKSPIELLEPHLKENLDYCLFLVYGIAYNLSKELESRLQQRKQNVDEILKSMFSIIAKSNAGQLLNGAI